MFFTQWILGFSMTLYNGESQGTLHELRFEYYVAHTFNSNGGGLFRGLFCDGWRYYPLNKVVKPMLKN